MSLANYKALLAKLSQKFAEIQSRESSSMQCGRACHACCIPNLTVFRVEKTYLKHYFETYPEKITQAESLEKENPHAGSRCKFLTAAGECLVYEARPVVCRSHGVPLIFTEDEEIKLDVCPLNFRNQSLETVPKQNRIHMDTLNTLLVTINREFTGDSDECRYPLEIAAILRD